MKPETLERFGEWLDKYSAWFVLPLQAFLLMLAAVVGENSRKRPKRPKRPNAKTRVDIEL